MSEEPVPTTKEELIQMLKDQLEKVQDEISEMQNTLEGERQKRKDLTVELEQKQTKIKELIENEGKALGDKVHEGLYNTLDAANRMRAEAEAEMRKLSEDTGILNQKITHKDSKVSEDRINVFANTKKLGVLQQKRIDHQRKQDSLLDKKQEVKKNSEQMRQEHERIQREEKELRNHLEAMKKLRMYLNKNLQGNLKNNSSIRSAKPSLQPDNFWSGN